MGGYNMYDYLIVGAGLFGSVFAYEANRLGYKCLVIDRRNHIGGNIYNEKIEGINVHKYGAHIFHTDNKKIWDYVNRFVEFNNYINSPIANFKGEVYNLPFNMNTFNRLWGVITPEEAKKKIQDDINSNRIENPSNLEEQAISLVGKEIYYKLIKGYTEKQWGRSATDIPAFIIKRLPVRFTYNNNYFDHKYQGIPIGGYNVIIEKMLDGIDLNLGVDFLKQREKYKNISKKIVYTGMIDEFYNYNFGRLEYRSLEFKNEIIDSYNYQGNAVVNYTDINVPFTRIIEHKHFEFGKQKKTVITREYSREWKSGDEPYYPINDEKNNRLFQKYKKLSIRDKKIIFGGRLADYKYYDMHNVIDEALKRVELELGKNSL